MNKRDAKSNAKNAPTVTEAKSKPLKKVKDSAPELDNTLSDSPESKVPFGAPQVQKKKDKLKVKVKKINWNPKYGSKTLSKDGKLQPKKPLTAYCLFNMEKNPLIREEHKITMMEASTKVSQLWTSLTDAERKPFVDKTNADKARYEKESDDLKKKGHFMLPDGRKSSDVRVPREGDPQPKQAQSAYMYFNKETLPKVRGEGAGMSMVEGMKKVAVLWAALTDEELKPFSEKSQADRVRHDKQLEDFNTMGYFLLPDGVKSHESSLVKKIPVKKQPAIIEKLIKPAAVLPKKKQVRQPPVVVVAPSKKKQQSGANQIDVSQVTTKKGQQKRDKSVSMLQTIKHNKPLSQSLDKKSKVAQQAAKNKQPKRKA